MQGFDRKYSATMATLLSQTMTLAFTITIPIAVPKFTFLFSNTVEVTKCSSQIKVTMATDYKQSRRNGSCTSISHSYYIHQVLYELLLN